MIKHVKFLCLCDDLDYIFPGNNTIIKMEYVNRMHNLYFCYFDEDNKLVSYSVIFEMIENDKDAFFDKFGKCYQRS